jgi:uncharacterized protein (DUF885 family)
MQTLPSPLRFGLALFLGCTAFSACRTGNEGGLELSPTVTEFLSTKPSPWADSAGTIANPALAGICRDLWEFKMKSYPEWATQMGDPRYNDALTDNTPRAQRSRNDARRDFQARLADIRRDRLTDSDALTYDLVQRDLANSIVRESFAMGDWNVNTRGGPQVEFLSLAVDQPIGTPKERADYLQRWRAMAESIRQTTSNVQRSKQAGRVASRTQIEKVLAQLENLLVTPAYLSALVEPAAGGGRWVDLPAGANLSAVVAKELGDMSRAEELRMINPHLLDGLKLAKGTAFLIPAENDLLPPKIRGRFLADVWGIVENDLYPAYREYRRVLRQEILPAARPDERAGVQFVPGGEEYYSFAIQDYTSLAMSAEDIHALGMAEVARINREMVTLGIDLFGRGAVADMRTLRKHMNSQPGLYYTSRQDILTTAEAAIERMQLALPDAFGRLPLAPLEVVPVPAHEEAFTTMAYYNGPAPDGSRPGRYFVNTFEPSSKPKWEAEVLAFHEGIPGHHLQIAIADELPGLPMVRRQMGLGAFVEGWALYSESLADDMGMYSSDLQRLGMLSFDAWRAARLVVDTGLHSMGWSRDRAMQFLEEHTLADRRNVENEIDRYISTPGQALGYKLGQLHIRALRQRAQTALGARFSLAAFHDLILKDGAVTLPMLDTKVDMWIEQSLGR